MCDCGGKCKINTIVDIQAELVAERDALLEEVKKLQSCLSDLLYACRQTALSFRIAYPCEYCTLLDGCEHEKSRKFCPIKLAEAAVAKVEGEV